MYVFKHLWPYAMCVDSRGTETISAKEPTIKCLIISNMHLICYSKSRVLRKPIIFTFALKSVIYCIINASCFKGLSLAEHTANTSLAPLCC